MEPATMMLLASASQAVGTLISGISAKNTAALNAFNIKTESILARAQAIQQSTLRNDQLKEAMATADALFMGAMGRDISDPSFQAMKRKELETTGEDISDIEMMSRLNQLKYKAEASAMKRKGRETLLASVLSAAGTAGSGYADYRDTAPRGGGGTGSYGLPDPFRRA